MPDDRSREPRPETKKRAIRKPYERPRIIYREPVEAMATVCSGGPAKTGVQDCTAVGS